MRKNIYAVLTLGIWESLLTIALCWLTNLSPPSYTIAYVWFYKRFYMGSFPLRPLLLLNERLFLDFAQTSLKSLRLFVLDLYWQNLETPIISTSVYVPHFPWFWQFKLLMFMKRIKQHKMSYVVISCCVLLIQPLSICCQSLAGSSIHYNLVVIIKFIFKIWIKGFKYKSNHTKMGTVRLGPP